MKYTIDDRKQEIVLDQMKTIPLYSTEGFRIISDLYLRVGWDQKHMYTFTWLGRPIIQIPEDIVRIQEVIYCLKPDLIVETGIAHGGSLVFNASLCRAIGKGRVVGVDIEIRPHNRKAIEEHELAGLISMIEGGSTDDKVFCQVRDLASGCKTVMVILDSCHSYEHVSRELELYSALISVGSYVVATDGSQSYLNITPRARTVYPDCGKWAKDNPKKAAEDFVSRHSNFVIEEPPFRFSESPINFRVTHWPSAFVKRLK